MKITNYCTIGMYRMFKLTIFLFIQNIQHFYECPEWDSNLGPGMSHRLNYETAALTTQPPRLDTHSFIANTISELAIGFP